MDSQEVIKALQILWANSVISADEYLILIAKIESLTKTKKEKESTEL